METLYSGEEEFDTSTSFGSRSNQESDEKHLNPNANAIGEYGGSEIQEHSNSREQRRKRYFSFQNKNISSSSFSSTSSLLGTGQHRLGRNPLEEEEEEGEEEVAEEEEGLDSSSGAEMSVQVEDGDELYTEGDSLDVNKMKKKNHTLDTPSTVHNNVYISSGIGKEKHKDKNQRKEKGNEEKRKRGRPPSKSKLLKNIFVSGSVSKSSGVGLVAGAGIGIGIGMEMEGNWEDQDRDQVQNREKEREVSSSKHPMQKFPSLFFSFHSNHSSESALVPISVPMKRGRGRPRKNPFPHLQQDQYSCPFQIQHQEDEQISPFSITIDASALPKLPSDYKIAQFIKNTIQNRNFIETSFEEVWGKLESHFGVDFSCRKMYILEVYDVLCL